MTCRGCNRFYIGETGMALNLRVNLHRQQIDNPEYSIMEVSLHIRSCAQSFSIVPIFKMPTDSTYLRKKQELFFINLLKPDLNSSTSSNL